MALDSRNDVVEVPELYTNSQRIIGIKGGHTFYVPQRPDFESGYRLKSLLPKGYDKRLFVDTSFANPRDSLLQLGFMLTMFSDSLQPYEEVEYVAKVCHGQTKALRVAAQKGRVLTHPKVLEEMLTEEYRIDNMVTLLTSQIENLNLDSGRRNTLLSLVGTVASDYSQYLECLAERSRKHSSVFDEISNRIECRGKILYSNNSRRSSEPLSLSKADMALLDSAVKLRGKIASNDKGFFAAGMIGLSRDKPPVMISGSQGYTDFPGTSNFPVGYCNFERRPN